MEGNPAAPLGEGDTERLLQLPWGPSDPGIGASPLGSTWGPSPRSAVQTPGASPAWLYNGSHSILPKTWAEPLPSCCSFWLRACPGALSHSVWVMVPPTNQVPMP